LDALLCSDRQTQAVHACLAETSRVLRVGGSFIMLTHRRGLGWHLAACSASYNAVVLQPPRQVGVPLGEGRVPLDGQAPDSASRPLLLASLRGHQSVVSALRCRSSRPAQSLRVSSLAVAHAGATRSSPDLDCTQCRRSLPGRCHCVVTSPRLRR
jgi:hypothetical protein